MLELFIALSDGFRNKFVIVRSIINIFVLLYKKIRVSLSPGAKEFD